MPWADMSVTDFLFHGRYHLAMAVVFLWVAYVTVRVVWEQRAQACAGQGSLTLGGAILHDTLLGPTMADGGQPHPPEETPAGSDRA